MARGNPSKLIPANKRSKCEASENGRKGGVQSGKARREKKLMSQIYADILADQSGIKGGRGIKAVVNEILSSTDPRALSARVSLMRELREGTEGSKLKTETTLNVNTDDEAVKNILAEYGISKPKD
jgi:hypothetical protein